MNQPLTLEPRQKSQLLTIRSVDFPDDRFAYVIPEAIGSADRVLWGSAKDTLMQPDWEIGSEQECRYGWRKDGILEFTAHARAQADYVDVQIRLANLGAEAWPDSTSFSCFGPREALTFSDFDGTRTYLLIDGRWKTIAEIERRDSGRPTIQLWYVKGSAQELKFVENFGANPRVQPAGILAVRSYDGRHVIAVTADKPRFLFSNLEFSCIHCCPTFGALKPGEAGVATHRVFVCKDMDLDELRERVEEVWTL